MFIKAVREITCSIPNLLKYLKEILLIFININNCNYKKNNTKTPSNSVAISTKNNYLSLNSFLKKTQKNPPWIWQEKEQIDTSGIKGMSRQCADHTWS